MSVPRWPRSSGRFFHCPASLTAACRLCPRTAVLGHVPAAAPIFPLVKPFGYGGSGRRIATCGPHRRAGLSRCRCLRESWPPLAGLAPAQPSGLALQPGAVEPPRPGAGGDCRRVEVCHRQSCHYVGLEPRHGASLVLTQDCDDAPRNRARPCRLAPSRTTDGRGADGGAWRCESPASCAPACVGRTDAFRVVGARSEPDRSATGCLPIWAPASGNAGGESSQDGYRMHRRARRFFSPGKRLDAALSSPRHIFPGGKMHPPLPKGRP